MTAEALFRELRCRHIQLWEDGTLLRFRGALGFELRASARSQREALRALLRQPPIEHVKADWHWALRQVEACARDTLSRTSTEAAAGLELVRAGLWPFARYTAKEATALLAEIYGLRRQARLEGDGSVYLEPLGPEGGPERSRGIT